MATVENKIVNMIFNNKSFEKGVAGTVKSLDMLDQKVNSMDGSVNAFSNLSKAASKVDFSAITKAADVVTNRLSAMGIVGVTALQNITNSAVNMGKNLIKSVTTQPISTGFQEYETKMNSIKTLMAAIAQEDMTPEMETQNLEKINTKLAELNEYADLTVYNFAQMTDMVGKFATKSGDLDGSVKMVKGMANLAAELGVDNSRLQSALYQTSQAMSGGYFQNIDWMSIENAGMASKSFMEDLQKEALRLGTITQQQIDDIANAVGGTNFNKSLSELGWLTTDVMTNVMAIYADSAEMTKKAGEINTFSKLTGVMAESVQSGWAVTWEAIIGDKAESLKLFEDLNNAFNSVVGPMADARNEMFKFWNDNGGRQQLIDSIFSLGSKFAQLVSPIGKAWKEIFPTTTGDQLMAVTENFAKWVDKLKPSEKAMVKIGEVSKGFFSALSIGRKILGTLIRSASPLVGILVKLAGVFLGLLSPVANSITKFNEFLDSSGLLSTFINMAHGLINDLSGAFEWLFNVIQKGWYNIKGVFDQFVNGFERIGSATSIFEKVFTALGDTVRNTVTTLLKLFGEVGRGISESLSGDMNISETVLGAGGLAGGFMIISKVIKTVMNLFSGGGKFSQILTNINELLSGVSDAFNSFTENMKSKSLKQIATSVLILTVALILLGTIDSDRLIPAVLALASIFAIMGASLKAFSKVMGTIKTKDMAILAGSLIALSTAVLILSFAVSKLGAMRWQDIIKGLGAVIVLLGALVGSSLAMSKYGKNMKNATKGLISLGLALILMATAINMIGGMRWQDIAQGLGAVIILLGALTISAIAMGKSGKNMNKGIKSMISMGIGLVLMAAAINMIGGMRWQDIVQGLGAVIILLGALTLASQFMGKQIGLDLMLASIGISFLALSLKLLSTIPLDAMMTSLLGLVAVLVILAAALFVMKSAGMGALVLVAAAAALLLMAGALAILSLIPFETLIGSIIGVAAALVVLGVAAGLIGMFSAVIIAGAAAIALIGVALIPLAAGLALLGFSLVPLAAGLGTLAAVPLDGIWGALGVLLVLALLSLVSPLMLALGVALTLLGAGLILTGLGLTALAVGMTSMDGISGLWDITKSIGALALLSVSAPALTILGLGLLALGAGMLLASIGFVAFAASLATLNFAIMLGIPTLERLIDLANLYSENMSVFTLMSMSLMMLATGFSSLAGGLTKLYLILMIFTVQLLIELEKIIDGFKRFRNALRRELDYMKLVFMEQYQNFKMGAAFLIDGFVAGLEENKWKALDKAKQIAAEITATLNAAFDIHSPSRVTREMGLMLDEGLSVGLDDGSKSVYDKGKTIAKNLTQTVKNAIAAMDEISTDIQPVIRPVLDTSKMLARMSNFGFDKDLNVNVRSTGQTFDTVKDDKVKQESNKQNGGVTFNQYNTSPKSLSRTEIYRQTRNMLNSSRMVKQ